MEIANIGSPETRKRLWFGLAMLALGFGAAAAMSVDPATPVSRRLLLFVPFWLAALGLLQAREKT